MDGTETVAGKSEERSLGNPGSADGSDEVKTESIAGFIEHTIIGFLSLVLMIEVLILFGTIAFIFLVGPAISSLWDYMKLLGKRFLSLFMPSVGGAIGA